MAEPRKCVHCGTTKNVSRPRGLCWTCYYTPGLRDQYPPVSKKGEYGALAGKDRNVQSAQPTPTDTLPGTEERFRVMEERVRNGQATKHPEDAR